MPEHPLHHYADLRNESVPLSTLSHFWCVYTWTGWSHGCISPRKLSSLLPYSPTGTCLTQPSTNQPTALAFSAATTSGVGMLFSCSPRLPLVSSSRFCLAGSLLECVCFHCCFIGRRQQRKADSISTSHFYLFEALQHVDSGMHACWLIRM